MKAGNITQNTQSIELNPESYSNVYFTIQGNIGCGKSTFLQLLRQRFPDAKWIEQPVSDWQNVGGKQINMLEKYYKEPKRWGFTFQIYAIYTRVKKLQQACERFPDKLKISERSILADKYVFAEIMKDLQFMDKNQYEVYKELYSNFQSQTMVDKNKIIYLRCSPQKCYERTKIRKREEENQIPLQYLQKIHEKHQNWFKSYDQSKVLILDTTVDFKGNQAITNQMVSRMLQFIQR